MLSRLTYGSLQRGLVLFWASWLTLIAGTNIADALKQFGALPAGFTWASYNFQLIVDTVVTQGAGTELASVLFAVVILWELLAVFLFWRAWTGMLKGAAGTAPEIVQAFFVSIALFAAFLIATEVFVTYDTASGHKLTLIALLVSLVVVRGRLGAE